MKFITLFSTLLTAVAAAPLAEQAVAQDVQAAKPDLDMTAQGVKILPRINDLPPKDGATRQPIPYGPYSVPAGQMLSLKKLMSGKQVPSCGLSGCLVTAMEATIKYSDGKEANIDTGAWLHHITVGTQWACGNERPTIRLNEKHKYGLDLGTSLFMMIDLMNDSTAPKELTLVITYETIPKTNKEYKPATMYWLTIGEPAPKANVQTYPSVTSFSTVAGHLLYTIGHMHDGGSDMRLYRGRAKSELLCKSVMHYNLRKGYTVASGAAPMAPGMTHGGHSRRDGHGGHGVDHISDPGACTDFGTLNKGDYITADAFYNANEHPFMELNNKKEKLMGNMRVYVGPT